MKILRVIASMDPSTGGPCQGIRNTVSAMKAQGVFNEVVCLDDPKAHYLGKDPFPIHALGPAANPWRYSSNLIPWLKENYNRFDAIIVHGLWLYPSFAVYAFFKKLKATRRKNDNGENKCPWYIMPHGMLDPYFQKASDRRLKALRNLIYWKLIESKVVHQADGILFTCQEELELAKTFFRPYAPQKELNIGYGIQPPPARAPSMISTFREKARMKKDQQYFLFLSRIHQKKGVDLLLKAYHKIWIELQSPDSMPVMVVAGPGMESDYGNALKQMVASIPEMRNRILFTGMIEGDLKWGAFYGCDAFVLPSHQENFGIAVAEALACGKPVLISNKVNIWREIDQNNAGIVASDDLQGTEELLRNWQRLTADEKTKMAKCARTAYESHFRIEANIKALIEVLSKS